MDKLLAGVDWISASRGDHGTYDKLSNLIPNFRMDGAGTRDGVKPGWMNGYYGLKSRNAFLGRRDDGMFVQVTSALADTLFEAIITSTEHVSRLDLQLTLKVTEEPSKVIEQAFEAAKKHRQPHGKPPSVKAFVGPRGYETLYIGAAKSEQRGRVYDKFEESGDEGYRDTVRYEVQLRNDSAVAAKDYIQRSQSRLSAIVEVVVAWYHQRGVVIPVLDRSDIEAPVLKASRTGYDATLGWLSSQVSPVLLRLMAELGTDTTLKALLWAFREHPQFELEIALCVKHLGM